MKKIIALLFITVLLCLTGCEDNEDQFVYIDNYNLESVVLFEGDNNSFYNVFLLEDGTILLYGDYLYLLYGDHIEYDENYDNLEYLDITESIVLLEDEEIIDIQHYSYVRYSGFLFLTDKGIIFKVPTIILSF